MNPNLETLLSRLKKVRGRDGSWMACCPSHDDKSPSMTIRDEQGKILIHCFAGCSVPDILGAVQMDMTDLFPVRDDFIPPHQPLRPRFRAADLLKVVSFEATIVAVSAHDLAQGRVLSKEDHARLRLSIERINEALEASNG
jgi:hypothetical protein